MDLVFAAAAVARRDAGSEPTRMYSRRAAAVNSKSIAGIQQQILCEARVRLASRLYATKKGELAPSLQGRIHGVPQQ